MNRLRELEKQGQSIWLDFITRSIISEGSLAKLIAEDGISGVTSNPTIFQKAITTGHDYDSAIGRLQQEGKPASEIFEALAVEDIQHACDLFRLTYENTQGADGFVSIEVNPHLARDSRGTTEEARRLFKSVNRPNAFVKIPGTKEGLPAIEQCLAEGININITLIFSLERYEGVINAWLSGLERAAKSGRPLHPIASVASFFVSRVDSLIDGQLQKKNLTSLMGKAAIANAQGAYRIFERMVAGPRFKALEAKGARPQRPLWASTSTKNPAYRDVLYVEELIGPDTVNTLPLATIDAFRDHGTVRRALPAEAAETESVLQRLKEAGVDMAQATRQLEEDGVRLFAESYDSLIKSLEQKKEALKAGAR
jgi:transaldolase